jgi:hypothetical protein
MVPPSSPGSFHEAPRWLLLIHQIPAKPGYFRAKVNRRLQRVGAVAIKSSACVLPLDDQTQEDLEWIAREIMEEGGEATLCKASFIEGLSDEQIVGLFQAARDAEYGNIAEEARQLAANMSDIPREDERRRDWENSLARLKKELADVEAIDFYGAERRQAAALAIAAAEKRLGREVQKEPSAVPSRIAEFRDRVWVTRKGIFIDRIASAWLIRRFIDPRAAFKFVSGRGYNAQEGELTFDMFEGHFTHEDDRCTFEVLARRFAIDEPGIDAIGEIVHDVDIKDGKFGRVEAAGVADVVAALALAHKADEQRLEAGFSLFDQLFELYRRKRK